MRLLASLLCLVLCATTTLASFGRPHAHLGRDAGTTAIHTGHHHDFDYVVSAHAVDDLGGIVNMTDSVPQQDGGQWSSVPWLALLYVVTALLLLPRRSSRNFSPARRQIPLPSQHPPWPPPVRGPPLFL